MIPPSNFENLHGLYPQTCKIDAVWKTAFEGLALGLTCPRAQLRGSWSHQLKLREAHLLLLKAQSLTHTSRSLLMEYCPRLETDRHHLHALSLLDSPFIVLQSTNIFQREAFTHIWCPNCCSCTWEIHLDHVAQRPGELVFLVPLDCNWCYSERSSYPCLVPQFMWLLPADTSTLAVSDGQWGLWLLDPMGL